MYQFLFGVHYPFKNYSLVYATLTKIELTTCCFFSLPGQKENSLIYFVHFLGNRNDCVQFQMVTSATAPSGRRFILNSVKCIRLSVQLKDKFAREHLTAASRTGNLGRL